MSGQQPKRRIFISYSHQPEDLAAFARALVKMLRRADFEVWMDEENIPGGQRIEHEIRAAIDRADVGLFLVTPRWLEADREWIRFEASLFARRQEKRRLVLLRETADDEELGPSLSPLKRIDWFSDAKIATYDQLIRDSKSLARFWEVYCGITGTPPGPREDWEQRGQDALRVGDRLAVSPQSPPSDATARPTSEDDDKIGVGKPIAAFSSDEWTWIVSNRNEWHALANDGRTQPIEPGVEFTSAIVTQANGLLVAGHDGRVGQLKGQRWNLYRHPSPVLCLASTANGDVVGTASGAVALLADEAGRSSIRTREPVMSIAPFDGGLLLIGSRGMFGRISWPAKSGEALKWIQLGDLGRAFSFYRAVESNQIGIAGASRVGVIDPESGSLVTCPRSINEGIRDVIFLGAQSWPYVVLTDAGSLLMVNASLTALRPVRLPLGATVSGCCSTSGGSALVWTTDGRLLEVEPEGRVDTIAEEGVKFAASPSGTATIHVIRWSVDQGSTVKTMRLPS